MFGKRKKQPTAACAVLVAAGSSRRMQGENKLLLDLCGMPVLAHTLLAFEHCDAVRDIVLVCREQDIADYARLGEAYGVSKLHTVTRGGESRTASVLAGVLAAPADTELVAVHDGARPLVTPALIAEAVAAAEKCGAAAPTVPLKDSVKRVRDGVIERDVPRDTLAAVQTPQVFRRALLLDALQQAAKSGQTFTDDCAAVEAYGATVCATQGSYENIKITTPEDMRVAAAFLQGRDEI